jgi:hypothetical protein
MGASERLSRRRVDARLSARRLSSGICVHIKEPNVPRVVSVSLFVVSYVVGEKVAEKFVAPGKFCRLSHSLGLLDSQSSTILK